VVKGARAVTGVSLPAAFAAIFASSLLLVAVLFALRLSGILPESLFKALLLV